MRDNIRAWRVYPRVCGGTQGVVKRLFDLGNLSPRVRGNPSSLGTSSWYKRSIPACAGEPLVACSLIVHLPVYPRVCGGTRIWVTSTLKTLGLSPRVRGNRGRRRSTGARRRSIPACAGEPVDQADRIPLTKVYPRVCGGT